MKNNGKIVIEKGVPIPSVEKASKYPFGELEVGDSFVAPVGRNSVSALIYHWNGKLSPKRFRARPETEKSTRIWRVE